VSRRGYFRLALPGSLQCPPPWAPLASRSSLAHSDRKSIPNLRALGYRPARYRRKSYGGTIRFLKTGTSVAIFIYGTNFGLARLQLKWLWMLRRSLPEMAQRVSKTEPILSGPEPALSRGERRYVDAVRKRKLCVPRFVAGNSRSSGGIPRCSGVVADNDKPRGSGVSRGKRPAEDNSSDRDDSGNESRKDPKRSRPNNDAFGQRPFACPYFKRNPGRFKDQRTCPGPGFKSVHRVK